MPGNNPDTLDTPAQARAAMARGRFTGPTAGVCPGYGQANLVVVPRDWAFEFLMFGLKNPQACPILEVLEPGDPHSRILAPGADIRRELPRYRVWEKGRLIDEPTEVTSLWRDDLVGFLIGCSFSFEAALQRAGLPVRHIEQGCNVPMYRTAIPTRGVGRLQGPLVVSMRPMPPEGLDRAREVTGSLPRSHGEPVHQGDPGAIGIGPLDRPDYGDPVTVRPGEVPVFWACGVTPQAVMAHSGVDFAITHAPGHMFITDLPSEELENMPPLGSNSPPIAQKPTSTEESR